MTELELYKFVGDKEIDWRGDKLMLWLEPHQIHEFIEVEGDVITDDGGCEVTLITGGEICIELNDICETHEINPENIHPK